MDAASGAALPVFSDLDLGPGSWTGLALVPGATDVLYAIQNPPLKLLDDPQFSRLVRVDLEAGSSVQFPLYDGNALGSEEIFGTAIAISVSEPDLAVMVGNDRGFPPRQLIWKVDLASGLVAESVRELLDVQRLDSLAFAPDGQTLLGTDDQGRLVSIDYSAASSSVIGDPLLSNFLTGLTFDATGEQLYAIEGASKDRLVMLSPSSGELLSVIGPLGISGPEGLAFVVGSNPLDCDGNGIAEMADLVCANQSNITSSLLTELGMLPGDLDGMNGVDFSDFLKLSSNFGQQHIAYTEGDINNDGVVGFEDFLVLSDNFGQRLPLLTSVPEPKDSIMSLIFATSIVCLCRARRHNT